MNDLREVLLQADPCQYETTPKGQREFQRRQVLAAVALRPANGSRAGWPRLAMGIAAFLAVVAVLSFGKLMNPLFVTEVQAAVRFEIKLAEDQAAAGLEKAKVAGANKFVYLHPEAIITNADIASSRLIAGTGPSDYGVSVEFKKEGAEKIQAATADRVGQHVAILIDGQLVAAPVIRTPISDSARVTGKFTRAQAERIVKGIGVS